MEECNLTIHSELGDWKLFQEKWESELSGAVLSKKSNSLEFASGHIKKHKKEQVELGMYFS